MAKRDVEKWRAAIEAKQAEAEAVEAQLNQADADVKQAQEAATSRARKVNELTVRLPPPSAT